MDPIESYWQFSLQEEYARNKELKESDVKIIQGWMLEQPHLPKLSGHQIILFLSASKYNLEKTKKKIDLNYTMRTTKIPEFFSNRDVNSEWFKKTSSYINFGMLPKDANCNGVLIVKLKPMDLSIWNFDEFGTFMTMVHDLCSLKYGVVPGYTIIQDMEHFTFGQMLRVPISKQANLSKFAEEASACPIIGIHVLNAGIVIEKLFALIGPFLGEKIKKMMRIHHNYASLHAEVDPSVLPSDYGGTNPPLEEYHEETVKALISIQPWFDEEAKLRVDESKRKIEKTKRSGLRGFFRKNDVN